MRLDISDDAEVASAHGAAFFAQLARTYSALMGQFTVAFSGGYTPIRMFDLIAERDDIPWHRIHVFQVDERVAPEGHPARNIVRLRQHLLDRVDIPEDHVHPLPVDAPDLRDAARTYADLLRQICGWPSVLDLVHLGLGSDGHVASLYPDDPLSTTDVGPVVVTSSHEGWSRMTLTLPVFRQARNVLWLVQGKAKSAAMEHLLTGDAMPASAIPQDRAFVITDASTTGTRDVGMAS